MNKYEGYLAEIEAMKERMEKWAAEYEARAMKAEAAGRKGWAKRHRERANDIRASAQKDYETRKAETLADLERATCLPTDSLVILVSEGIRLHGMPVEEGGPCVVRKYAYGRRVGCSEVLGYAATQVEQDVSGWFCRVDPREVFVLSNVSLPDGAESAAARFMVNWFPTVTQARRAVARVHWLPVLSKHVRDPIGIARREWKLSHAEGGKAEPLFILWVSGADPESFATEEFGRKLGEELFGFAAVLPPWRAQTLHGEGAL